MFVFLILPSLYATAPPAIAMTENRSLFIASLLRRSTFSTFVVDYCKAIEQNEDTRSVQFSYLIPVAADRLQVSSSLHASKRQASALTVRVHSLWHLRSARRV